MYVYIYSSYMYIIYYEYVFLKKIANQIFKIKKIRLVNNDRNNIR